MAKAPANEYEPDMVSPPGDTLLETIETLGMSQSELARRMGRPRKTMNEIIRGKAEITPETALQLERVLGVTASFWLNRERHYREWLARQQETQQLLGWINWLKEIPIREMMHRGWIPAVREKQRQVYEALRFFGVASPDAWYALNEQADVAFRQSHVAQCDAGAVSAWLRQGEIKAIEIDCSLYDEKKFLAALACIRALTVAPPEVFQPEVVRGCAEAGVAVVFVPELPRTGTWGATRWLTNAKALLQVSLRYRSDDHFWFSFFHEAGHIVLHKKHEVFLECGLDGTTMEQEANTFAADHLIPRDAWQAFHTTSVAMTRAGIERFAEALTIAPGIVVGRLQHEELLPHSHCNDLKRRFTWNETEN